MRNLGQVVATITVDHLADADFWLREDRVRSALYVHRMPGRGSGALFDYRRPA